VFIPIPGGAILVTPTPDTTPVAPVRRPRRQYYEEEPLPTSGKAIWSLIFGLLSFCLPVLLSLVAILLGFLGLGDVHSGRARGGVWAVLGLLCGLLTLITSIALVVVAIMAPAWIQSSLGDVDFLAPVLQANQRLEVMNHLRQLGEGMQLYRDNYRGFPPPAITDADGKPLLSWRVAILPYIDQEDLFKKFRSDEPWNSPHNSALLKEMPRIFAHPLDPEGATQGRTHYQVFVTSAKANNQSMFSRGTTGKVGIRIEEMKDDATDTIMIVESARAVPWTAPEDLPYEANQPLPKLGLFSGGFLVVAADGSVHWLPSTFAEQDIRNAITVDDGQAVDLP
jgi:hypothetical protein